MALLPTSPSRRRRLAAVSVAALLAASFGAAHVVGGATAAAGSQASRSQQLADLDAANLRLAAQAIEAQALISGALQKAVPSSSPAVIIMTSDDALIVAARRAHPSLHPTDTRSVMGSVPFNLKHPERHRPGHSHRLRTHLLDRFRHTIEVRGAYGVGAHDGARVAPYLSPDGRYVDPHLPSLSTHATVAEAALRYGLRQLG